MPLSEQQISDRAKVPSIENSKSVFTYEEIKSFLIEKFGTKVSIFLQGSYANKTNIRKDSDIDIVICHKEVYFKDISFLSKSEQELYDSSRSPATYTFSKFKQEVYDYLISKYGIKVERKNKCIRISLQNDKYVDVDVIPCFVHKRFNSYNSSSNCNYNEGIEFKTDDGENIVNFPKQHELNGEKKNTDTQSKYKDTVRIIKNCKKHLLDNGVDENHMISSFMIECCVWNIHNSYFNQSSYKESTNNVIKKLWNDMQSEEKYNSYAEVCDLFRLFRPKRNKSKPLEVKEFLEKIYNLINY